MRTFLWIVFLVILSGLALWIVLSPWFPKSPMVMLLVVAYFAVPNIGTIWMLFVAIRHEESPLPFVLLAFVPYSFLWYYFERFRHQHHQARPATNPE
jgi:hypothetical protein